MTSVILASESRDLVRTFRHAVGDDVMVLSHDQVPAGPAQLLALAEDPGAVHTVLIDGAGDEEVETRALQLAARLEQASRHVSFVLISPRGEAIALEALRSGVRDILPPDASVGDIRWLVRRAGEAAQASGPGGPVEERFTGRVVAVASPKGGVGKTTISTNLATALAAHSPTGTVLVDLDVQFGDVAMALDLDPTYTIGDVLSGPAAHDAIALKSLLTQHSSGLYVLPGVRTPVEADQIDGPQIARLIETLKREFRYVIVDTAPGLSPETLAALDHATDAVLVSALDVPSLRGMRKELQLLEELEPEGLTRHLVVNLADKGGGLSVADASATLGRKIDVVLPRSTKVLRSVNEGVPIVLSAPRDGVSKQLTALAERFAPLGSSARGSSGRHRGLMGR